MGAITGLPVLLAPLRLEAIALRKGMSDRGQRLEQIGMGHRRAAEAGLRLSTSLTESCDVVVAGVAGALDPSLMPGDVVVASEILPLAEDGGPASGESIGLATSKAMAEYLTVALAGLVESGKTAHRLPAVVRGPIGCTTKVLAGNDARTAAFGRGVLAVEMESLWCLPALMAHRCNVVRVVLDRPGHDLVSWRTAGAALVAFRSLSMVSSVISQSYPSSFECSTTEV